MIRSWLLHYTLLVGLSAAGSFAKDALDRQDDYGLWHGDWSLEDSQMVIWERVKYVTVEMEAAPQRVILQRIPEPTAASAQAQGIAQILSPTAAPVRQKKRQDQGQINALSGEIQRLSISFSSISSASQSISQSAQQVAQSANQATNDASQAISRTQSSASSAVANAFAQASSQVSSQVSANLVSVQASASSAISRAQVSASASMSSAIDSAMSQIQAARAEVTAVRGDANNFADQVQKNAISTTNLAIIVSTSVSGAVILTSVVAFLCLRYRRKRRERKKRRTQSSVNEKDLDGGSQKDYDGDYKGYDKPIAVRGSPPPEPSSDFKLPRLSPPQPPQPKPPPEPEPLNFGFAMSDYSDAKAQEVETEERANTPEKKDVYGVFPASFRLQKPPTIKSAETVRIIRVKSGKNKAAEAEKRAEESTVPVPETQSSQSELVREEVPASSDQIKRKSIVPAPVERLVRRATAYPAAKPSNSSAPEPARESKRFSVNSFIETIRNSKRFTMGSVAEMDEREEESGWRPPSSGVSTSQRYKFYESGMSTTKQPPMPVGLGIQGPGQGQKAAFSMANVSSLVRSDSAATDRGESSTAYIPAAPPNLENRQPTIPKLPKNPRQGPSFAAFPSMRRNNHPPGFPPAGALPAPPRGATPPAKTPTGTPSLPNRPRPPKAEGRKQSLDGNEPDMSKDSFEILRQGR